MPQTDEARPPLPPFDLEGAMQKVRMAEDAWNSRDPAKVSLAYAVDSVWRNRTEFLQGRDAIVQFLTRKWANELGYLSRSQSIGLGYVIGGLTTLVSLPVLFLLRGLRDPADKFVGIKAGTRGTCAAQGIPAISQVEAMPVEGAEANA